jgi:hypothetical protein
MRETWYVLDDGSVADPREVAPDKNGVLRHKNGAAVAMRGDVPSSRSVDPEEEKSKSKKTRDMQPEEPKRGYKTR